jgi:hypothetical protein
LQAGRSGDAGLANASFTAEEENAHDFILAGGEQPFAVLGHNCNYEVDGFPSLSGTHCVR